MINTNTSQRLAEDLSVLDGSLLIFLESLLQRYQPLREGFVLDEIPELAAASPDWFGISVVSVAGQVINVGDTGRCFTLQSISKPFVYGLALEDHGQDYVLDRIGVEPTGDPFNSIIESEEISKRQYNPMVNAGAIATTSLVRGSNATERRTRLLQMFQRYTGHEVQVHESVARYRQTHDNLNRAIAYMMRNFGLVDGDIDEILSLYFQQCSLLVNCSDLAVMAATLANAGINPITGEQAIAANSVKNLLSIMYTCGLYDFSGQWAYKVGFPAKSGLSGAILAVIPNHLGVAVYSPPLGDHRKSVRAVEVFEILSERLRLHIFTQGTIPSSTLLNSREIQANDPGPLPIRSLAAEPLSQPLLGQATRHVPSFQSEAPLTALLEELYHRYLPLRDGKAYVSEPDLIKVSPDWFGLCAVTVDGQVYAAGDWKMSFLIQSISKIFVYGLALMDHGRDYVLTKVDVEPTGDAYNSIIKVEENSKRPYNPMVNPGAIAITSLIKGAGPAQRLQRILEMYRRYVGHPVFVDTPTYVSEQNHGDRNWAIAYMLRNFKMISGSISQTLDLYLQQCSVIVNCCDLAIMGATLASEGINPMTGEQAIDPQYVQDLLSIMFTCGMYDFAGEWVYNIGFPAKSGVGGGIIGVVPGQMGIAVFSPPLDEHGNSLRGIKVCQELSQRLGLHIFQPQRSRSMPVNPVPGNQ